MRYSTSAFESKGAPAEVVRRVLADEVRAYLLATHRVRIATKEGWLMVGLPGVWTETVNDIRPAVQCVAAMVTAVRAAWLVLDEATATSQRKEMVFRGIPDDAPLREARAAREAEIMSRPAARSPGSTWDRIPHRRASLAPIGRTRRRSGPALSR